MITCTWQIRWMDNKIIQHQSLPLIREKWTYTHWLCLHSVHECKGYWNTRWVETDRWGHDSHQGTDSWKHWLHQYTFLHCDRGWWHTHRYWCYTFFLNKKKEHLTQGLNLLMQHNAYINTFFSFPTLPHSLIAFCPPAFLCYLKQRHHSADARHTMKREVSFVALL